MAITGFTGPPGSGKSHALVKDVIVPAVMAGRRVLTNIDGIDADAVRAYCLERSADADKLGGIVQFHGDDARKPDFWPDETTEKKPTFVTGGDLVVFDEWALSFPRRGAWPQGCNVEAFLRWHRHLNGPDGTATDIAIGTQLPTDIHPNVRGLMVKSYKFRKLTAIGAKGQYTWQLFEGHLQPKNGHYRTGTGTYDKAIFPLYASSAAAKEGNHVELRTNSKESIWSGWTAWAVIVAPFILIAGGGYGLYSVFSDKPELTDETAAISGQKMNATAPMVAQQTISSTWRIVGHIDGESGSRIVVANNDGVIRMMTPDTFEFSDGRPISGTVDGQRVVAEDRLPSNGSPKSPFGGGS
jgi:zona occludens toxin